MRQLEWILRAVLTITSLFMVASCAEPANSGAPVAIPTVVVNCTSVDCRRNLPVKVYVYFTASSCDPAFIDWATVSSSFALNCSGSTGCYGSPSSWVDARGAVTTIPSGTYTLCGRVDYDNDYPTVTNNDSTANQDSVAVGVSTPPTNLTTWTDF
jgi:hypothetical protein